MFDIKVKDLIREHCVNQLKLYNFGKRGRGDGNYNQQLTGIIGQSVVADVCGFPLVDGSTGFDNGEDIRIGDYIVDIKTMGRNSPVRLNYVGNFPKCQDSYNTDVYIFTSLNKKTDILTIVGWLPKGEFLEKAILFKAGEIRTRNDGTEFNLTQDNYEIGYSHLRITQDADHLMNQIYMAWKPKMNYTY